MLCRVSTQSLRMHMSLSLRTSPRFTALRSFSQPVAPAFDAATAQERQRERRRTERTQINIEGTTEFYTRQLVVLDPDTSAPVSWPKKIEFSDHVVATYVKAVVAVGQSPKTSPLKTIAATPFPVTTCGKSGDSQEQVDNASRTHDLLVFPDGVRVRNVHPAQVPLLVTQLLQPSPDVHIILQELDLSFEPLEPGHHILVCAHESRDERCGCNGPKLLRWLHDVAIKQNIPLHLYSSSHFGGHRYAANCIAYPSGDWFGLLNEPHDADALVAALEAKQPLRLHTQWRGRIAMTKTDQLLTLRDAVADV